MQIKYFQTAWNDIKNSEGWFGKLCLLALLNFIPIFGQIVSLGYLYGWAREISWGVHEPLPAKIMGNEDGKLYRRGWFILVLVFVFSLVPSIVSGIGSSMQQAGYYSAMHSDFSAGSSASAAFGSIIYLIGVVGALFVSILSWIGSMRISIYDSLSSGFQLGKIWKMLRHDTGGIMRIFGMNLLVSLIIAILLSILFTILITLVVLAGISGLAGAGYSLDSIQYMSDSELMTVFALMVSSAGFVGIVSLIICLFIASLTSIFVEMLVARALGYWTWQFDVPHWGSKDDPLPFELAQGTPPVQ